MNELPQSLQDAIDKIASQVDQKTLQKARQTLTEKYKEGKSSHSIFSDLEKTIAYLAVRLPATYAASSRVLQEVRGLVPAFSCKTVLDVGAGPAAASFAAVEVFPEIERVVLLEQSFQAIDLGKRLEAACSLKEARWICQDIEKDESLPVADLAILSYSLGELKDLESLIGRLWNTGVQMIVIIEPGTPRGYQVILQARKKLLALGGHLVAPCPHAKACPLQGNDWCHFGVRLTRTRLHRALKEGTLGYEDEKYSYLVVSRGLQSGENYSRILRPPQKLGGHSRLFLCTDEGAAEERVVSRKQKELYRRSRDCEWGDRWLYLS